MVLRNDIALDINTFVRSEGLDQPFFWSGDDLLKENQHVSGLLGKTNPTIQGKAIAMRNWWEQRGQYMPSHLLEEMGITANPSLTTKVEDKPKKLTTPVFDGEKFPLLRAKDDATLRSIKNVFSITTEDDAAETRNAIAKRRSKNLLLGVPEKINFFEEETFETRKRRKRLLVGEVSKEDAETSREQLNERIIRSLSLEQAQEIERVARRNPEALPEDFVERIEFEVKVKRQMKAIRDSDTNVLLTTISAKFLKGPFNVFEYVSREQDKPSLLDLAIGEDSGDLAVLTEAADRIAEGIESENPGFWKTLALSSPEIANAMIEFGLTRGVLKKSEAFSRLPGPIQVGITAGVSEAIELPRRGETFEDRAKRTLFATEAGFAVGTVFDELVKGIGKIRTAFRLTDESKVVASIRDALPGLKGKTDTDILTAFNRLKALRPEVAEKVFERATAIKAKVVPKVVRPSAFRPGKAEITPFEEGMQRIARAARQGEVFKGKITGAIAKELAGRAPKVIPVPPKIILSPIEAKSFTRSNLITGEAADVRIVVNPKVRRSIQSSENKIATLKTRIKQLTLDKKFSEAHKLALERDKAQAQIDKLKQSNSVKLVQNQEQAQAALDRMRQSKLVAIEKTKAAGQVATARQKARVDAFRAVQKDALSLINIIPKSEPKVRVAFENRVLSAKSFTDIMKLSVEIDERLQKIEIDAAVDELALTMKKAQKAGKFGIQQFGAFGTKARDKLVELIQGGLVDETGVSVPGEAPVPLAEPSEVEIALTGFNLKKLSDKKRIELEARNAFIQRLVGDTTEKLAEIQGEIELTDPAMKFMMIPESEINALVALRQKHIRDYSLDEILGLTRAIQIIANEEVHKRNIRRMLGKTGQEGIVGNTVEEIALSPRAAFKEKKGAPVETTEGVDIIGGINKFFRVDEAKLHTLTNMATGKSQANFRRVVVDGPRMAEGKRAENVRKGTELWREFTEREDYTFKDFRNDLGISRINKDTGKITFGGKRIKGTIGNTDVNLRPHEAMAIFEMMQNVRTFRGLMSTDELVFGLGKKPKTIEFGARQSKESRLEQLNNIVAQLSEKQKNAVLEGFKINNKVYAPLVNEESRNIFGFDIATEQRHVSLERHFPKKGGGTAARAPETGGRYQPITAPTSKIPIRIRGYWFREWDAMQQDSFFNAFASPLRDMRVLTNNARWQNTMIDSGHRAVMDDIITMRDRITGLSTDRSIEEEYGQKFLGNFAKNVLPSLSIGGVQAASTPLAKTVIPAKFFKATDVVNIPGNLERAMKTNARIWMRYEGNRVNIETSALAASHPVETMIFKHTPVFQQPLKILKSGDQVAIVGQIWPAARRQIKATERNGNNIALGEWNGRDPADLKPLSKDEDLDIAAGIRTVFTIENGGQPDWAITSGSVRTTSPRFLTRLVSIFRTARNAGNGIAIDAQTDLIRAAMSPEGVTAADVKKFAQAQGRLWESAFLVATIKKAVKLALAAGIPIATGIFGIFKFRKPLDAKEIILDIAKDTAKARSSLIFGLQTFTNITERFVDRHMDKPRSPQAFFGNPYADVLQDVYKVGDDLAIWTSSDLLDGLNSIEREELSDAEYFSEVTKVVVENRKKQEKAFKRFGLG
ncbi:hypothetical protein LCGC14_1159760, partial [marine sediment metagenome]